MTDTLLPFQPRGQWLRQRRQELGLGGPAVAKALGLTSYLDEGAHHATAVTQSWTHTGPKLWS
mgnify:CR=1 FL=1